MAELRLIVGLGNPGPDYEQTRHNVGAVWVRQLAHQHAVNLKTEAKLKAEIGRAVLHGVDLRLMVPTTYMNLSGEAVGAVARFYKIAVDQILVAYDEMAFSAGDVRLRAGGGDNGHNGIKSVVSALGNNRQFHRLRIGVDHPGHKDAVTKYLTQQRMPLAERELVEDAWRFPEALMAHIVRGEWGKAMNILHTQGETPPAKPNQSPDQE